MEPFQIGNSYYIRFSFKSKQCRFGLRISNKKRAQEIADQIERGLEHGIFDSFEDGSEGKEILKTIIARPGLRAEEAIDELRSSSKRKRFTDAVAEYLENCRTEHAPKNYLNEIRVFKRFSSGIKAPFIHNVETSMVEKWRNDRVAEVEKATINRELKMIKRFFNQAAQKGYIHKSPANNLKAYREPERPIRFLSDDEIKMVLDKAPDDLKQIIIFFLLTGLRYGELCHLMWSDIDFRRKQIIIQPKEGWAPKNLKKRIIPMHTTVEQVLSSLHRNGNDLVFPNEFGNCAQVTLRDRIYSAFKKAKVRGNIKDLRSTFASNAVMSGMPIFTLAKLLGHGDVKITEKHYTHLAPDYMSNAITVLNPKWQEPLPLSLVGPSSDDSNS